MFKRLAVGLTAAAVGGSVIAGSLPAMAERTPVPVSVDIVRVQPDPVVVKGNKTTYVSIDVLAKGYKDVEVSVKPDGVYTIQSHEESRWRRHGDWLRFTAEFDGNDPKGRWIATATAVDANGKKVTDDHRFTVEHEPVDEELDTRIVGFDAGPEPIRKNRTLHMSGRLQAYDHGWEGYENQEVEIYFRASGSSTWKYITRTETRWDGRFWAKARATKSGTWRAVFDGNDEAEDSRSVGDFVHVRGWNPIPR
ncbi:hypothetical protein [Rhizohabitans arisaemae]|uniref:hypothetical protein n=1 Tax=Rhizohabitans arisaemae TaxID=2720610 RepID=UPI0024B25D61|nr:hypothetical protein [Rhizohabitans arisaemae]